MMRSLRLGAVVAIAAVALVACRGPVPDAAIVNGEIIPVARVDVLAGRDCGAKANVVSAPEYCRLLGELPRTNMLSTDFEVVTEVDSAGRAGAVKVLQSAEGLDVTDTAVECARRLQYAAGFDAHGQPAASESCPITLRLTRFASDVGKRERAIPVPCPVVRSVPPPQGGGTDDCTW